MEIKKLMSIMIEKEASDLFYRAGGFPRLRINGEVVSVEEKPLTLEEITKAIEEIMPSKLKEKFTQTTDIDFAVYLPELDRRFRVSIFIQRNFPCIVIRAIKQKVATFEELNLPGEVLRNLSLERRGMVLLTGSMGSGKSTTIASMIEFINQNRKSHILTIEEPIEFTFKDKLSIINQRELGLDVPSYVLALRAFTLHSPDVIFIGNIRDYETMNAAITAAETGVLVLSTLHTINASQTIERIINFFPPYQHAQIRMQLSYLLKGVISLRLLPLKDGFGMIPACEIMLLTPTISRLIREGKTEEIPRFIEEGKLFGMQSFTQSLVELVKRGLVSEEIAREFSDDKEEFSLALKGIKKI